MHHNYVKTFKIQSHLIGWKKLKICMFSNLFPPVSTGSSTHVSKLSQALTKKGHHVFIITAKINPKNPTYENINGVDVYRLPSVTLPKLTIALNFPWLNFTFTPQNLKKIQQIIQEKQPDIIHLHNHMFDLSFSAVLMHKKFNIPLITTLHTIIKHSNNWYNLILHPLDKYFLGRLIINQSDQIICPDANIEKYAKTVFKCNHFCIIPYGVELSRDINPKILDCFINKYSLKNKNVIISLGHVHEIRNRHDLITAMPLILKQYPNTILLIVGAVITSTPEKLARSLNVGHAIIFTGTISHKYIPEILSLGKIEAHWLNQDNPENTSLGIASLEAMASKKVILAAANPDTYGPDVLRNGENIILVNTGEPYALAETIIGLFNDEIRCKIIGNNASKTIERFFSWDSVCDRTVQLYLRTVSDQKDR